MPGGGGYPRNDHELGQRSDKGKMLHKAMGGGTTGRAEIGYLNVHKDFDGRLVNTIDVAPKRAPLGSWASERYATGVYSMSSLRDQLAEQGLTLVTAGTFERVQEVLAVRRRPVQRDQVHTHFLRGLMCCDRCDAAGREHRMIYTEAENRSGQLYGHFLCRGRQESTCNLPHLPAKDVERAVPREVKALG